MILIQFAVCMVATISFAVLFAAPRSELLCCGFAGALGWAVYLLCSNSGMTAAISSLLATLTLTLISRAFAALRRIPVTVYLISGIFPLVPGAGIYYTSYHFIMDETAASSANGVQTAKVAGAIVLGIIAGFAVPQGWFHALSSLLRKDSADD